MALLCSIKRVPLFTHDWVLKVTGTTVVMLTVCYSAGKHSTEVRELGTPYLALLTLLPQRAVCMTLSMSLGKCSQHRNSCREWQVKIPTPPGKPCRWVFDSF